MGRTFACFEVVLVFAVTHSAARMIKGYTAWGRFESTHALNFTYGLCMIAAVLTLWSIHRRHDPLTRTVFGLSPTPTALTLHAGIFAAGLVIAGLGSVAALGLRATPSTLDVGGGIAFAAVGIATAGVLLISLRGRFAAWLARRAAAWGIAIVAVCIAAPIVRVVIEGGDPLAIAPIVAWRVIGAGIGEELFFRGYIQGRLNQAFGTPVEIAGVRFGFGIIGATLLFGLAHLLNPFNTFTGAGHLAWGHGIATAGALSYGVLRARCGSVGAPIVLHVLIDTLVLVAPR